MIEIVLCSGFWFLVPQSSFVMQSFRQRRSQTARGAERIFEREILQVLMRRRESYVNPFV
jgi:hypothetical protein